MSQNRLPAVNKFQYKPKESPAFNDLLNRKTALENLKSTYPEPMHEKYYQCTAKPEGMAIY